MSEQLELFGKCSRLRVREAVSIYWELEGRLLPGHSHKTDGNRILQYLGDKWLHELTDYDVKTYRAARKIDNPDLKESTLNREHTRITRLVNAFKEWKRTGKVQSYDFTELQLPLDNPGELVRKVNERKYRRTLIVTPEMFAKFCDYAHPEIRRICTIAIMTLLRRKDIRLLQNENLNRALDNLSGVQSKTGLEYNVPATLTVRVIFNQAKEEERKYVCDFTNFRRRFQRARLDSGVYFQLRDLRKSGATQLLLDGIDIRTIQRYLGHADIATTEIYLNPPAPVAKEAARLLEERFLKNKLVSTYEFSQN